MIRIYTKNILIALNSLVEARPELFKLGKRRRNTRKPTKKLDGKVLQRSLKSISLSPKKGAPARDSDDEDLFEPPSYF